MVNIIPPSHKKTNIVLYVTYSSTTSTTNLHIHHISSRFNFFLRREYV